MGKCNIDHSQEDVLKKLQSQEAFLPSDLNTKIKQFLTGNLTQETLNELFHLLKKYDLASAEDREERNEKLLHLVEG